MKPLEQTDFIFKIKVPCDSRDIDNIFYTREAVERSITSYDNIPVVIHVGEKTFPVGFVSNAELIEENGEDILLVKGTFIDNNIDIAIKDKSKDIVYSYYAYNISLGKENESNE